LEKQVESLMSEVKVKETELERKEEQLGEARRAHEEMKGGAMEELQRRLSELEEERDGMLKELVRRDREDQERREEEERRKSEKESKREEKERQKRLEAEKKAAEEEERRREQETLVLKKIEEQERKLKEERLKEKEREAARIEALKLKVTELESKEKAREKELEYVRDQLEKARKELETREKAKKEKDRQEEVASLELSQKSLKLEKEGRVLLEATNEGVEMAMQLAQLAEESIKQEDGGEEEAREAKEAIELLKARGKEVIESARDASINPRDVEAQQRLAVKQRQMGEAIQKVVSLTTDIKQESELKDAVQSLVTGGAVAPSATPSSSTASSATTTPTSSSSSVPTRLPIPSSSTTTTTTTSRTTPDTTPSSTPRGKAGEEADSVGVLAAGQDVLKLLDEALTAEESDPQVPPNSPLHLCVALAVSTLPLVCAVLSYALWSWWCSTSYVHYYSYSIVICGVVCGSMCTVVYLCCFHSRHNNRLLSLNKLKQD